MITVIEPRNYMDNDSEESIGFRNHSLRTKNEFCDSMLRVCDISSDPGSYGRFRPLQNDRAKNKWRWLFEASCLACLAHGTLYEHRQGFMHQNNMFHDAKIHVEVVESCIQSAQGKWVTRGRFRHHLPWLKMSCISPRVTESQGTNYTSVVV